MMLLDELHLPALADQEQADRAALVTVGEMRDLLEREDYTTRQDVLAAGKVVHDTCMRKVGEMLTDLVPEGGKAVLDSLLPKGECHGKQLEARFGDKAGEALGHSEGLYRR